MSIVKLCWRFLKSFVGTIHIQIKLYLWPAVVTSVSMSYYVHVMHYNIVLYQNTEPTSYCTLNTKPTYCWHPEQQTNILLTPRTQKQHLVGILNTKPISYWHQDSTFYWHPEHYTNILLILGTQKTTTYCQRVHEFWEANQENTHGVWHQKQRSGCLVASVWRDAAVTTYRMGTDSCMKYESVMNVDCICECFVCMIACTECWKFVSV